ncbi:M18 family aminopeptidase [Desulfocastanea catecholica]
MNQSNYNTDLFSFLSSSPTPYHAVAAMEDFLRGHGFIALQENVPWHLEKGFSYFVTREKSATIAFTLGSKEEPEHGFRMLAAHTDSPCLQIKPRPDIKTATYQQLGVEIYGGGLLGTWFDRDLSLAGRVAGAMADGTLAVRLVDFHRPLLTIPSIAIHFNREANTNNTIDRQKHLPPIIAQAIDNQLPEFKSLLLKQILLEHPKAMIEEILAFDLFCYDFHGPTYLGMNNEFISSARLDNLLSCHAGMTALAQADRARNCLLFCANHEENGSTSATGAHGSFIDSVIERILPNPEARSIALSNSLLISMDNAHAAHPNFMDKIDATHEIHLNKGPVIKLNANQRYATNSLSAAIYKLLCREAGISCQEFVMRSDMPCGSTIGPITAARLGVKTIDVGAPSLAMHSIRELTGSSDPFLLSRSIGHFLSSDRHRQLPQ